MIDDWFQASILISYKIFASIRRQCQYSESPQPTILHQVLGWKGVVVDCRIMGTIHTNRSWNASCMKTSGNREILLCGPDLLWNRSCRFTPIRGPFNGFPYISLKYEIILMNIAEYFTFPSFPWYLSLFHEHLCEFWTILLYSTNGPSCVPQARKH